jgi:hypothetical protein
MKIKCPVGGCDIEFSTMEDLYQHFLDNPHGMNFKYFYWEMYKKIHEKIESLDEARMQIGKPLTLKDADAAATQEWGITLLKSLLENEK